MENDGFLRRKEAAGYLTNKFGFGAEKTLAKGVVTGDSPEYRKAGRIVLYTREALDRWAMAKLGPPQKSTLDTKAAIGAPRRSTSDRGTA